MTDKGVTVSPQRPRPGGVAAAERELESGASGWRASASQATVNTESNSGCHRLAGGDPLQQTSRVLQNTPGVADYRDQGEPTESKRFYFPELDILRFCAFLMVFLCHTITPTLESGPYGHFFMIVKAVGALGVPVFFFLSAYLITELLLIEKGKTGHINIRNFYVRRILRIWPLYFLFLGTAYTIGRLLSSYHLPAAAIPYYLLLGGNWWKGASGYAGPLWTISVEEQFYLIWPTLANRLSSKALAFVSAGIWVSSQIALSLFAYWHLPIGKYVLPNSFVQFQFFALGALTALLLKSERPNFSAATRIAIASGGIVSFFLAEYLLYATVRERDASLLTDSGILAHRLRGCTSIPGGFRRPRSGDAPTACLPRKNLVRPVHLPFTCAQHGDQRCDAFALPSKRLRSGLARRVALDDRGRPLFLPVFRVTISAAQGTVHSS